MMTEMKTAMPELWLRAIFYTLAVGFVLEAVWLARLDSTHAASLAPSVEPSPQATTSTPEVSTVPPSALAALAVWQPPITGDLPRLANPHTDIPARPRYEIIAYTAVKNDTLFGIASKYNLKPDSLIWANPKLIDDPNSLSPGQILNIIPTDGALRIVQPGDTLEKIAVTFHVTVEAIVNYPGNELDPSDPQIHEGQSLILPGGWREALTWSLPVVARTTRGRGNSGEPGACAGPFSGPTGTYTFVWPANNHYLSGTDFILHGHPGIDIAAGLGAPIYASDTGVVVFSGWSTHGYGNLIIIDHGNGWQTAYAHLSQFNAGCGASVYQGQVIGLAGSTGNSTGAHLHFELRNDQYGRVNPWLYLP
jgi:murein DD-endopeptidase MepM/ murein hydrolase activator NlpD